MFGLKKKKTAFPEKRLYSIDEYLEIEGDDIETYEFWNEQILQLNQPNYFSQSIFEFEKILSESLSETHYKVFSNFLVKKKKIWIESENCLFYPDLFIVKGEIEYYSSREDIVTNPLMIMEISTRDSMGKIDSEDGDRTFLRDRASKFWKYQNLPSLKEYVLIADVGSTVVETYNKFDGKYWKYQSFSKKGNNLVNFESIGIEFPVTNFYI